MHIFTYYLMYVSLLFHVSFDIHVHIVYIRLMINSAIISISLMQPRLLSTCGVIRLFALLKQRHSLCIFHFNFVQQKLQI